MWRWSHGLVQSCRQDTVFSTYVEVILHCSRNQRNRQGILHVCGGDPNTFKNFFSVSLYSPRMWRWSWWLCSCWFRKWVFSTHVEVMSPNSSNDIDYWGILHTCGGDPYHLNHHPFQLQYSPHMWRWSSTGEDIDKSIGVFSTHVEVIPI